MNIQMVDLMGQYKKIKAEVDRNIINSIESGRLINGPIVNEFCENLKKYLNVKYVIPCANGTDALQIAFMALGLKPGDEVICSAHTMIATASAIKTAGGTPIPVDINDSGLIDCEAIDNAINSRTVGIMPTQLNFLKPIQTPIKNH